MAALDSITTSSGDIKTPATQVLPSVAKRRRRLTIAAGLATVALGSAVVVFASQRSESPPLASVADTTSTTRPTQPAAPARPVPKVAANPPAPIALTAADSLAIARAVQKRLAKEEELHGPEHLTMFKDSIAKIARKVAIDSIVRANLPRGAAMPVWTDFAPFTEFTGKRRVVVTEPKVSKPSAAP
jgi:hypothetical protein